MAARLPATRRRLMADQYPGDGQSHLGGLGGERLEIPFRDLDSRLPCDSRITDVFFRPQFSRANAKLVHSKTEPIWLPIRVAQAGSRDRFDSRLAAGPLPAP
jgi:hypothetical protein